MTKSLSSQQKIIILLCIIISALFCTFYQLHQLPHYDQAQMYDRGLVAVFEDVFIPHGNEASTTSNVPGSISSIVVGLPLKIAYTMWAPLLTLTLIKMLSGLIFLDAVSKLYSSKTVVIAALIYFLNPWFLFESIVYNPSYLALGATLVLNCLVRLRVNANDGICPSAKTRFIATALAVVGIGWCLEFHFSWPVLLAICGILWLKKSIKISYFGLAFGIVLVLLSLIPYFIEVLNVGFVDTSPAAYKSERYLGYGFVHVYPLFKAILYWIRLGSLSMTHKILLPDPSLYPVIGIAYNIVANVIGGLTAAAVAYFNYKVIFKFKGKESTFGRELVIAGLLATLIAAGMATLVLNYWQIIIVWCFTLIPVLEMVERSKNINKYIVSALVIFALVLNIQASLDSEKYRFDAPNMEKQLYDYCIDRYDEQKCSLK